MNGDSDLGHSLYESLASPLTKAYRVGGFGLAFLLLGASLMLTAVIGRWGWPSYAAGIAGFVLVLIPAYFFYIKEIRPIGRAQRAVEQNKELIDAVDHTLQSMLMLCLSLQGLLLVHAEQVNAVLSTSRAQLRALPPPLGMLADRPVLKNANAFSQAVVAMATGLGSVLGEVKQALIDADPGRLRRYLADLDQLGIELKSLASEAGLAQAPDPG